jgi:hypothetical protein
VGTVSLIDLVRNWLRPDRPDDDLDTDDPVRPGDDTSGPDVTDGGNPDGRKYLELPDVLGIPPNGDTRKARELLERTAQQYAAAGMPSQYAPTDRPLDAERAAERHHAAAQRRIKQWAPRGHDALQALRDQRRAEVAEAEAAVAELERTRDERIEELRQYDDAIAKSDPERRYEDRRPVHRWVMMASPLLFAFLEFPAVFPAISRALNISPGYTVPATLAATLVQVFLAEATGMALHRWYTTADPPPMRRFVGLMAIAGLTILFGFVAALVKARASLDDAELGAWSSLPLLLTMQVGFVIVSLGIGWYNSDPPEVAARRRVAADRNRLIDEYEAAVAWRDAATAEVQHLDGLIAGWAAWVEDLKQSTRIAYEAELLEFRSDLAIRLEKAGKQTPAEILALLPLPALTVPIDEGDLTDDDDLLDNPPDITI